MSEEKRPKQDGDKVRLIKVTGRAGRSVTILPDAASIGSESSHSRQIAGPAQPGEGVITDLLEEACAMPEISRFLGLIISMYYSDHRPPHFHVRYGDHEAIIEIVSGRLLGGSLPPRAGQLVEEWRTLHVAELEEDWELAESRRPMRKIAPLE